MKESCELQAIIPATPAEVYEHWLSSEGHAAMTGGEAVASSVEGEAFTAWDGYIWGENLELDPGKRIVQSWRTSEFEDSDEDSRLDIRLQAVEGGTKITLTHTHIPEGQTQYELGWKEHYFEPMMAFFAGR